MGHMAIVFDDDYSVDKIFGEWLKDRRVRKGFSLEHSSFQSEISITRLRSLEGGVAEERITPEEVMALAKVYGLDPRAITKRAQTGEF